jgi:serine/threonine protein kinase
MSINVGSPLYMPYESLHEKKFSTKSDIFALGVIWYELLTGKTPFDASSEA